MRNLIRSLGIALAVTGFLASCQVLNKAIGWDEKSNLSFLSLGKAGVFAGSGKSGPSGTTIQSTDGLFSVFIPEGAMDGEESFEITKYDPPSNSLPQGYFPTTQLYEITPSYRFKKDVIVTITLDSDKLSSLNLNKKKSQGFVISQTPEDSNSGRITGGWNTGRTSINGDKITITTRTFSVFGGGTPPAGNNAPNIMGAFYYFKTNCSYLPYMVRTRVIEPDGDPMQVYLLTGTVGNSLVAIPMTPESGNWYSANIPYEAMVAGGIQMQVLAVDSYGNNSTHPTSDTFKYPVDAGNSTYTSGFKTDQDNDGYLDAWEVDNGFNPNSATSPPATLFPDSDSDGIPNIADRTPNGEVNPPIDSLTLIPSVLKMDVGENVTFAVSASFAGQPRFVRPNMVVTGNAVSGVPVGTLTNSTLHANAPGLAGVTATVGNISSTTKVTVVDSVAPSSITDLTATAMTFTQVRLRWTAPGNDSGSGRAAAYEIRRSSAAITNNLQCDSAPAIAHSLVPKNSGLPEVLDINGHSPNNTYYYCIRAFDWNGNRSSWTGTVQATTPATPDLTRPGNITNLNAVVVNETSVDLTWTAVGDDNNTGIAAAYDIRKSTNVINTDNDCDGAVSIPNALFGITAGSSITFRVNDLSEDTRYYFCVRAYDEVSNRSSWNGTVSTRTRMSNKAPIVDAGPDQLDRMISQVVNLNGTNSSDPDKGICGANVSNYSYQWRFISRPIGSALLDSNISNGNQLSASFVPDIPGNYLLELSFRDDAGTCYGGARTGIDSVLISAKDLDSVNPDPVSSRSAAAVSLDQIQLNWYNVGDDGMVGPVSSYKIGVSLSPITNSIECDAAVDTRYPNLNNYVPGQAVSFIIGGLLQNTVYNFCIVAYDDVGNKSPWSGILSAKTLEGTSGWGTFTSWGTCSTKCGAGTQSRSRVCLDPTQGCAGSAVETQSCSLHACAYTNYTSEDNGTTPTASCPSGFASYTATSNSGYFRRVVYDYWGEGWACGIIPREDRTAPSGSYYTYSLSPTSVTFYYAVNNPPPVENYCVSHTIISNRSATVYCMEKQY